ncbi:MAG: SDR family NAD(P)-dependent oxidoreductase [Steroidobacteraceae bacterium]
MTIQFDEQVAIVTGGGGGLGFSIAQELAARGCAVLVNDYGGDRLGDGAGPQRAEEAASKLRATGARAVADATAVGTPAAARSIVAHALGSFGRIDILVNNAGIARPATLTEATDEHVEQELRTNLLGPYALVRAVWDHMKSRKYGRILNVSSNASLGIGANSSYAVAKAGLIGLTMDSACEGQPYGILVNALMPVAHTRMIEGIPDPQFVAWFRRHMAPQKIAGPLAYFLSSSSTVTGSVLSMGGGRVARVMFAENAGVVGLTDAEAAQSAVGEILGSSHIQVIDSCYSELRLYTSAFPFEGKGSGPALDEQAVVGASQKRDM